MTIGNRIKEHRIAKGWTQDRLADESGLSRTSIHMYEKNETMPRMPQLKRLAAALDVDLSELQTGANKADEEWLKRASNLADKFSAQVSTEAKHLSDKERFSLYAALSIAIDSAYKARNEHPEIITRLGNIIAAYGNMITNSYDFRFASKENPNSYLVFLRNYEKCVRLINEHKEDLIESSLAWLEDDSKLRALIYGEKEE